jgi:hypothetical protein
MKLTLYDKATGEPLPQLQEGRDYIIFSGELYECEFGSGDGNHLSSGEAWKVNIDWGVKAVYEKMEFLNKIARELDLLSGEWYKAAMAQLLIEKQEIEML